jgi:hypothetical protein
VADALVQAGEQARAMQVAADAEQIARGITYPSYQAVASAGVDGAFAQAGEHDRGGPVATDAEQIARGITNPYDQAGALADVAGALADAGDARWAARLLGAALRVGDWTRLPLDVVTDVRPDVIRTIAAATTSNRDA